MRVFTCSRILKLCRSFQQAMKARKTCFISSIKLLFSVLTKTKTINEVHIINSHSSETVNHIANVIFMLQVFYNEIKRQSSTMCPHFHVHMRFCTRRSNLHRTNMYQGTYQSSSCQNGNVTVFQSICSHPKETGDSSTLSVKTHLWKTHLWKTQLFLIISVLKYQYESFIPAEKSRWRNQKPRGASTRI